MHDAGLHQCRQAIDDDTKGGMRTKIVSFISTPSS
jgi:hypothetical protein